MIAARVALVILTTCFLAACSSDAPVSPGGPAPGEAAPTQSECAPDFIEATLDNVEPPSTIEQVTAAELTGYPAELQPPACAFRGTSVGDSVSEEAFVGVYIDASLADFDEVVDILVDAGFAMSPVSSDLVDAGSAGPRGDAGAYVYLGGRFEGVLSVTIVG